jgi:Superfamily I DNA and RNA helicases and helicase subunits
MYRGLYSFLQANKDRKDLLLNQCVPKTDFIESKAGTTKIQEIVNKAVMAKDYFLLVGPPGTGKTSLALKSMVEESYRNPNNNILLLSYTNRAVDEICDALNDVCQKPSYIRIGSELSCEEKHRERLFDKIISCCNTRDEIKEVIKDCRVYVGTVASFSNKLELFKLKHFQVAIIDEASQILEPHILGILSAKDAKGANAIDKFILIGDHKQLPAIVLQKEEDTEVNDQLLNNIGLTNSRESLFERLYNFHKKDKESLVCGMLYKQGRMHPEISEFPNNKFYNGQLEPVPVDHQKTELEYLKYRDNDPLSKLLATKRIAFIPSEKHKDDKNNKINTYEACIVSKLVQQIFELYQENKIHFLSDETIGVITPYRSQIALIKREIHKLNIPELDKITIDTVERFQGSQRDIILYSFSVNDFHQLKFLSSNSIEEGGVIIDRKLNVAITRAKKQFFVTGNPTILWNNLLYNDFIEFIRSKSGYIFATPEDFIAGKFTVELSASDYVIDNEDEGALKYTRAIQTLLNPSFSQIIDTIKVNCFQQCPSKNLCLPWSGHDRGRALLTTHQSLCKYLCAYGNMHEAKMHAALSAIPNLTDICQNNYSVIDWGCGQGLATICFFDYLEQKTERNKPQKVILIEPSEQALNRAKLHINAYLKNEINIQSINKYLNDINREDIHTITPITIHFFSNILDISSVDIKRLANLISSNIIGEHYFVCIEPLCKGCERIDTFASFFSKRTEIAKDSNSRLINVNGWRGVKFISFKVDNNEQ